PINEDVQGYVNLIKEGRYDHALALIKQNHPFPGVLGRCCHHPCEKECPREEVDDSLTIAGLKRFAADHGGRYLDPTPAPAPPREERVAIVGAGPAGLTAAYRLALEGYRCTVLEKLPIPGGMLSVGIPEYRLPKDVVNREIAAIESLGVEIRTNMAIGRDFTIEDLRAQGYAAILLAVGGHKQRHLYVPGEDLAGVLEGVTMLREWSLGEDVHLGPRVVVIGGGDVAVDASRVAIRLKGQVQIVYRRRREDMPARSDEVEEAIEEGVELIEQLQPVEIVGRDGRVTGVRCAVTRPTEPGPDGRVGFEAVEGAERVIECDTVIVAIGQVPDIEWLDAMGMAHLRDCDVIGADAETCTTCELDVFASGDAVTGPAPLVNAVAAGKRAAASIMAYLRGEEIGRPTGPGLERVKPEEVIEANQPMVLTRRQRMPRRLAEERVRDFAEVALGLPEPLAVAEASRCLDCGVCSNCADCVRVCPWIAIDRVEDVTEVDPEKCDSCGLCVLICQQQAIEMVPKV
ncbi:MAG TPA: FAD-dependent oxidoreductase, partial [Armatimonadota bacterium]|nr:FAD-dependent oxidoreductase [Armatimonadota bacterium]